MRLIPASWSAWCDSKGEVLALVRVEASEAVRPTPSMPEPECPVYDDAVLLPGSAKKGAQP